MPEIHFNFVASGADQILGAYRSVDKAAKQQAEAADRAAARTEARTRAMAVAMVRASEIGSSGSIREISKISKYARDEAKGVEKAFSGSFSKIGDGISRALTGALSHVATSAADLAKQAVGAAIRENDRLKDIANRVSINGRMPGQKAVDPEILHREFLATAIATPGQSAENIGKGVNKFVELTGDIDQARKSMMTLATVASATGASVEDVATAAYSMDKQFDIKKLEDVQQMFAILTSQGKASALPLGEMAAQLQKVAASAHAFGVSKGVEGFAKVGGLLQVARHGTGSGAQAGTATEAIFRGLDKANELHKIGVSSYDKAGKRRNVFDILPEVMAKSAKLGPEGQDMFLKKTFGAIGGRGVSDLKGTFRDASEAAGGGDDGIKAGTEAVRKALDDAAKSATDYSIVTDDAAQQQQSTSDQVEAVWEKFVSDINKEVMPALKDLGPVIKNDVKGALEILAKAAGGAADMLGELSDLIHTVVPKSMETQATEHEIKAKKAKEGREALEANIAGIKLPGHDNGHGSWEVDTSSPEAQRFMQIQRRIRILKQNEKSETDAARKARGTGEGVEDGVDPGPGGYKLTEEQRANLLGFGFVTGADGKTRAASSQADHDDDGKAQNAADHDASTKKVVKANNEAAKSAEELGRQLKKTAGDAARHLPMNKR